MPLARVIENNFIEVGAFGVAEGASFVPRLNLEWVVLKIEAANLGERGHRIDPLLASGDEQRDSRTVVHFGLSNFGIGEGDMR